MRNRARYDGSLIPVVPMQTKPFCRREVSPRLRDNHKTQNSPINSQQTSCGYGLRRLAARGARSAHAPFAVRTITQSLALPARPHGTRSIPSTSTFARPPTLPLRASHSFESLAQVPLSAATRATTGSSCLGFGLIASISDYETLSTEI